jgi:gp16 family phage-associated protein
MTLQKTPARLKTREEAKAWFVEHGISISEWCRQHGFGLSLTHNILSGKRAACRRGQSHQIAVLLGLKHGVIDRPLAEVRQKGRPIGGPKGSPAAAKAAAEAAAQASAAADTATV